jgi:HB1, ASXL, restriction endonuclease HTH domain
MSKESQIVDPYEAVIADLESKRDQLNQTIQMLRAAQGLATVAGVAAPAAPTPPPSTTEGPGAFLGMTVADAAVRLLGLRKTPLSNPEIVQAIRAGGVILNSAEPVNVVGSILNRRASTQGDIVRVGKTWGLAEWYPNAGRFQRQKKRGSEIPLPKEESDSGDDEGPDEAPLA